MPLLSSLFLFVFIFNFSGYSQEIVILKEYDKPPSYECGKYGGKLVIPVTSGPKSFNPILAKETSTTSITSLIFEGLTTINPYTLEVEPQLAETWECKENGKVWIFHLRKNVFWNDGEKFTADDVVFTFNKLIYNPHIPNSAKDIFTVEGKKIKVEKIDDFTVKFTLPQTFAPFLRSLSQEILPKHKLDKIVENGKFNSCWSISTSPEEIVGTGPYKLKKFFPEEMVILERNPYYWKKDSCGRRLPYIKEILFLILPNQDTSLLKFIEGEVDYYPLRGEDLPILGPLQKRQDFTIYNTGASWGSNFLVLNQNPGRNPHNNQPFVKPYKLSWFKNRLFREAIALCIDKKKIIDLVYNGLGTPLHSPLNPSNKFYYNPHTKRYPYNPQKAKEILLKLGFKDVDGDGILEDEKGHEVEIVLFTNSNNSQRIQIASIIKKDLQDVGIKVYLIPLDFNTLVTKLTSTFDWEMVLIGLTGTLDPHFGKNVWYSSASLHMWYPFQKKPSTSWEKEVDKIFDEACKTLDENIRRQLYNRWQEIISYQLPVIYIAIQDSIFAVRNKFGNVYPSVWGGAFPEVEYVYIKTCKGDD